MSIEFTKANSEYFSSASTYTPPSAGSISLWLLMPTKANNDRPLGINDQFELRTSTTAIFNELYKGGGGALSVAFANNTLYHAVFTWSDVAGTVTNAIYLDGALAAGPSSYASTSPGTGTLRVGASRTPVANPISGTMHDLRIYHKVLSADEINQIYVCRGTDMVYDSLYARFLFNEVAPGVGQTVNAINEIAGAWDLTPTNTPTGAESVLAQVRRVA